MRPMYKELLEASSRWIHREDGVTIRLSFHNAREEGPRSDGTWDEGSPGTWCWYLLIPEQMYAHRWADFVAQRSDYGYYDSDSLRPFDHSWFHGGITWYDITKVYCRKDKYDYDVVEIGCDYNHYWDQERDFPDTYESVLFDARRGAQAFLKHNPDFRISSGWSGRWGNKEEMILCVNGCYKHPSDEIEAKYEHWATAVKEEANVD